MNFKTFYSRLRVRGTRMAAVWLLMPMALTANAQPNPDEDGPEGKPAPWEKQVGRPDHVNNALLPSFPPVFNQDGGSCGSASRISYMFAQELNSWRGVSAQQGLENVYPSHFTWLLTNSHSGKEGMARANGVPNAVVYGGTTYSRLFGNQDCADPDFGWMQGYDKWYGAMFNRIERNSFSNFGLDTEKGREYLKNWLWNHWADARYRGAGGIAGIGVASACRQGEIADDPEGHNRQAGVVGMKYVTRWGDGVDHALTIVGYDDRIVFDLDSNKVYGEADKDERGAWIIVNSWGNGWANRGFIYCPYKYSFPVRQHEGGAWKPEFYHTRMNYRPLRTLRVKMDYSRRSELKLKVGIATDPNATEPEAVTELEHFKFAGDGRWGLPATEPAAATPMLGRWADGRLHTEPMEFGYDLTDLSADFDASRPLKYFFIIEQSNKAEGEGTVYEASIVDYTYDLLGTSTSFCSEKGEPLSTTSHVYLYPHGGHTTVLTATVSGEPLFAPRNLRPDNAGNELVWDAPQPSHLSLVGYVIYQGIRPIDTLAADVHRYALPRRDNGKPHTNYAIAALYDMRQATGWELPADSLLLQRPDTIRRWLPEHWTHPQPTALGSSVRTELAALQTENDFSQRHALQLTGGSIGPVGSLEGAANATIEFWLRPDSLRDWNQNLGPGWGRFMMHASANGSLSVGWDADSRLNTQPGTLRTDRWQHIAIVVEGNRLSLYINGEEAGSITSDKHSGMPNDLGKLTLGRGDGGGIDGQLAELRIWRTARSAADIKRCMRGYFAEAGMPETLVAYYPGLTRPAKMRRRKAENRKNDSRTDTLWHNMVAGGQDALIRSQRQGVLAPLPDFLQQALQVGSPLHIVRPDSVFYTGRDYTFRHTGPADVEQVSWKLTPLSSRHTKTDDNASLALARPTFDFNTPGTYELTLTARRAGGGQLVCHDTLRVSRPEISAQILPTTYVGSAGERISFRPAKPLPGARYEWTLKGADRPEAYTQNAGATYEKAGRYTVSLQVTDPLSGQRKKSSLDMLVRPVAPVADFDCHPLTLLRGQTVNLTDKSRYAPTHWAWQLDSRRLTLRAEGKTQQLTLTEPGVYDVSLTASNEVGSGQAVRRQALIVCNADSKNGLNFSREDAAVTVSRPLYADSAQALTVEWWMNASAQKSVAGIGHSAATWQIKGNAAGSLSFEADSVRCATPGGFIKPGQWHHYAVRFHNGQVDFLRDGEMQHTAALERKIRKKGKDKTEKSTTQSRRITALPATDTLRLGSRRTPMNAVIDELRIWHKALADTVLQHYINAPITNPDSAGSADGLALYYDFNQNGGDVADRTGHGFDGRRTDFGPDGDAWGRSGGVFCLNFNLPLHDLTDSLLPQARQPFATTGRTVNPRDAKRFVAFNPAADSQHPERCWIIENSLTQGDTLTTGLYVDRNKQDALCVYTNWDGFANRIDNHKCYVTLRLEPGKYEFDVDADVSAGTGAQLMVAEGKGLPDVEDANQGLASCPMSDGRLCFIIDKPTEVSIGMRFSLKGRSGACIRSLALRRAANPQTLP